MNIPKPRPLCSSTVRHTFQFVYGEITESPVPRFNGARGCVGVEVSHLFSCCQCDSTHETPFVRVYGFSLPVLPEGWHQLPDGILCPGHTLRYEIDGVVQAA